VVFLSPDSIKVLAEVADVLGCYGSWGWQMITSGRLLVVGALALGGYLFVNDVQADDVVFALEDATLQAQDFVDDVEFEGADDEFPSIILDDGSGNDRVTIARQGSGGFNEFGPTSAVAFGLDTDTETDLTVEAPSAIPRPSAQTGTAAAVEESPASESTVAPETTTTAAPETTTTVAPETTTTAAPETTTTTAAPATTAAPETTVAPAPEEPAGG